MEQSAQVPAEVRKGRNQLAATVVAGHGFKHIYNSGWSNILLPEIKIDMDLSGTQFGVLVGSSRVTGWVTTMVAGYLGDRFSHRAPMMLGISMAFIGVSHFLAGVSPNYWVLVAVSLLLGIGPSLYHPPAISSLSRRFPDRRGFAISLHGTGGSIGEVVGPWVAAGALALLSWRGVLQLALFPAVLASVAIWFAMGSLPRQAGVTSSLRAYFVTLVPLLKRRPLQVLVGISALRNMGGSAVIVFLPVYLREDLAFSPARVALYLSMAQVVGIGAQPVMGFLSDRFGRKAVLASSLICLGLLYSTLSLADPGAQLMLAILAMGAFHYSVHSLFIAAAMDVAGGQVQSTVVSLIYGSGVLGALSPILAGAIADSYGVPNALLFGGSAVILSGAVVAMLKLPTTATQQARKAALPGR